MRAPLRDLHFHRAAAFTLVELLTVMAVIIALVALVTANIGDMGGSRNLANGGSMLRDLINQARQSARSHNSMTMFVSRLDGGDDAYRCFTILERRSNETQWRQVAKWERLPDGIALDPEESKLFVDSAKDTATVIRPILKYGATNIQPDKYAFKVFLPGGRLLSNDAVPPVLYVKKQTEKEAKNYYKIILNPTTGIPLVKRP